MNSTILDDAKRLLGSAGYALQTGDDWFLGFCMEAVEQEIRAACNTACIPHGLEKAAVRMVVGQFLMAKKNSGQLDGFELNFEPVLKQLQEGDTHIVWGTYAADSPGRRYDAFIEFLLSVRDQFVSYRRVKW